MANEITGDDILIGVLENTLVFTLGSGLDGSLDLIVGGLLLETHNEIDDGNIDGGNTESEAANDRQLVRSKDKRLDMR